MQEHRKLAAIMFTDIVGYTALMGKNEQNALGILHRTRDVVKLLLKQFNGELLKEMGDGTLSSFGSVVDAVNCALEIQNTLKDETEFKLRIGIHIGDVVVEESGDVFGDGVNVASRIENLAEPGGICISGRVYEDIRNKPDIEAVFLGEKTLKNVDDPMKIYSLTGERLPVSVTKSIPNEQPSKTLPSIAVLPFVNMSADPEQEYFCDGMTEEIINALTHIEDLRVIARTSAFAFKGKNEDIREIGNKLDVKNLLEGSIRKAGNRLRITAQLIKVEDGSHLWSERFDREMEDVFAIQDEISLAIVDALKVKLMRKYRAANKKHHNVNAETHELYLKGRYYWNKRNEEGFKKSLNYYHQAIEKNSNYALAYAGIADSYNLLGHYGLMPPKQTVQKIKEAANKALQIDKTLAEAYTSLAYVKLFSDYDWSAAEKGYKQALEINPGHAQTHYWYAYSLDVLGYYNKALVEIKRAHELDPLSTIIYFFTMDILSRLGRYDEAFEQFNKAIEIDPKFGLLYMSIGSVYWKMGNREKSFAAFEKGMELGGHKATQGNAGYVYAMAGERDKAKQILNEMLEQKKETYFQTYNIALVYVGLEDTDKAIKWLEKAFEEHDPLLPLIRRSEEWDPVRSDPRIKALIKKMGLPED